ncbi:glycosyl hydrolase [Tunicatimonas pelagia]|uniref:glycosyl hydrolase n=1 Tax=Tunicatimonas pelagia TaxID=931531 RepID=UPI00266683F9|nr:glycosyl hydrolase [Tunicatimonas pelagia]WKN42729.1 glycosyl hydrolase [Tunicatimonas pelagia]
MNQITYYLICCFILFTPTLQAQPNPTQYDLADLQALEYRLVGPFRGGRCTAVAGIPSKPLTFFMGTTGGGVWKTEDGGGSWQNVSDGFLNVGSIGSIEVSLSDPNVIYVGTGSAPPRGNVSAGRGIYKSTDGGKTWKKTGLEQAGQLGKIQIHPNNPDLLYVAALGNIFGPNSERGVFRSEDGGENWVKALYINDSTGVVDLVLDPTNPRVLYAGAWQVERKPWTLIDGGKGSGLFKSTDGGDTWKKVENGLPTGVVGRVGVTVSPVNSQRVWAIMEHVDEDKGGIYLSEDAGNSWHRINRKREYRQRAWYYSRLFADPQQEHTVYVLNTGFYKSLNDGANFERISVPHGDNHNLWINPNDPKVMIQSNDGGANISFNGGKTWSTQHNQPTAELYRVSVDNQFPYRVYGAQQDNTTISVPSQGTANIDPIQDWYTVGGGESGHIAVHPDNPDLVYAGNYIGIMTKLNRAQGHIRSVEVYPELNDGVEGRDLKYRFQWNAPIRFSPHNAEVLYYTSNYVHKSIDGGQSWEVVSPDLTQNIDKYLNIPGGPIQHDNTGVELYCTIFAFEESPLEAGVLWAGSDDGLIHISRDGGENWENVTPKNMPTEGTVNTIDPSPHQAGKAYASVYKYRDNNFKPYVYLTEDYGKSWKLLTDGENGIPNDHFVRVVREDPDRAGLLYAGTEFGMYVSFNDGTNWQPLQLNLPVTPITDLKVHQQDLVVATQGRSFWILDDLTPLHQLSSETAQADAHLFKPSRAYRTQIRGYRGENVPESKPKGTVIYYSLDADADSLTLSVLDSQGQDVCSFSSVEENDELSAKAGLQKFVWDLKYPEPDLIDGAVMSLSYTGGPMAVPGTYQVKLIADGKEATQPLELKADPRWASTTEDLQAQFDLAVAVRDTLTAVHDLIRTIRSARTQINEIAQRSKMAEYQIKLGNESAELSEKLTALEEELIQTRSESSQDPINYPVKLDNQYSYLYTVVHSQDAYPTKGCYERFDDLNGKLAQYRQQFNELLQTDIQAFEETVENAGIPRLILDTSSR